MDCGVERETYLRTSNDSIDIYGDDVKICPICDGKLKKEEVREKVFNLVEVKCGACGQQKEVFARSIEEPVDFYGAFIDIYFKDQEYQRLMSNIKLLEEEKNWKELAYTYSLLSDVSKLKASELSKEFTATRDGEKLKESDKWRNESTKFKLLEREIRERIKDGDFDEEIVETIEDEGEKLKKDRTLEEVFDDPGFLEW